MSRNRHDERPRSRARAVAGALAAGALLLAAVAATVGFVRSADGSTGPGAPTRSSCPTYPGSDDHDVSGLHGVLTGLPSEIEPTIVFQARMVVTLEPGRPPITIAVDGGGALVLYLLDSVGDAVGSGNFARVAVGPTTHTVDARGLSLDAAGVAYRCVDLDDARADPAAPLPPGDYRVQGVLSTDIGYVRTPPLSVHLG